jgi:DNA repair protein RadC
VAICDWPAGERPREKLLARGARQLSDAELVAIFLRTGVRGLSAVDLARQQLGRFESLMALTTAPQTEFCAAAGLGPAKYAQLQAALEIARRGLQERLQAGPVLSAPQSVRDYLRLSLQGRPHEVFLTLFLDAQHRVVAAEELFRGTLTQTSVYPREVVKQALQHNAAAVIFAHNHPSGVAEPSRAD